MESAKSTPGAWKALSLLLTLNLLCYMDRYILSAVLPGVRAEFLADDPDALAKSGFLFTAFLLSYMVLSPLFGWLSDRFSRWVIIAIGVAIWSVATAMSGWASTFVMLLIARILVGAGEAAYGPASPTIIADLYPVQRRGVVLAWFFAAIPVGSALGYMFGGAFEHWRTPFHYAAIPGLVLAAVCLLFKDNKSAGGKPHVKAKWADYRNLFRIPSYVINVAAQTAMTFAIGGMSVWAPTYFHTTRGIPNLEHINFIFGLITAVSGLLATLLGGWLGDYFTKRFPSAYFLVSACGMLIAFPCTLAMLWAPFPLAWVFCFFAVFFLFMNIGPANTAIANVTSPSVRATAYAANIFVIHALGDAISPPLIGAIADRWTLTNGFFVVSLAMLVAGLLWIFGARYLARDTAAINQAA